MTGVITTIQRMSIHDGPGIRSTVFLKGCNLRCGWCHNPETWEAAFQLQYIHSKCIRCGECVAQCDEHALEMTENGVKVLRERCNLCGRCVEHCASGAMVMVGEQIEAEEVVRRAAQDKPFYDESGGGVTLSGGEPLMQPEFSKAILWGCQAKGIHTALETNLTAQREIIDAMLPVVDLWMCDLKTVDAEMHKKYTGASNERILTNLNYLATKKVPIIVRTPVVPEFNDNEEAITAIYKQIKGLPVKYELLEFHTLGFDKFNHLGMNNPCEKIQALSKEKFAILNDIIQQ